MSTLTRQTNINAADTADMINDAYMTGFNVVINGRVVQHWNGNAAGAWGTGSVSVEVVARGKAGAQGKTATLWIKAGAEFDMVTGA